MYTYPTTSRRLKHVDRIRTGLVKPNIGHRHRAAAALVPHTAVCRIVLLGLLLSISNSGCSTPSSPDPVSKGKEELERGDVADAISSFTKALASDPKNPNLLELRGKAHHSNAQYDLAVADFTSAINLGSSDFGIYLLRADAYWNMGTEHIRAGRHEMGMELARMAMSDCDKVIKFIPGKMALPYCIRGWAHTVLGRNEAAIQDFSTALELESEAYSFTRRGRCWDNLGKHEQAIADFTSAINADPTDWLAYCCRAQSTMAPRYQGEEFDAESVIADCTEAIQLSPNIALPYKIRAEAYDALGRKNEAEKDRRKADELER